MDFVRENTSLTLNHIIRYRSIIFSHEIDTIIAKMNEYVASFGAKTTRVLTITQGLSFETGIQKIDMEFMVEANQPIKGNNLYRYLPEYKLNKTVSTSYVGHPQNANMATKEVQQYIQKKNLKPITAIHQVVNNMKNEKKNKKKNEISLEVHVGIE